MRKILTEIIKDSLMRNIDKSCKLAENLAGDIISSGRVLVLPCEVGAPVYYVDKGYTECSHYGEKWDEDCCLGCDFKCDSERIYTVKKVTNVDAEFIVKMMAQNRLGKTHFLSEEEAIKSGERWLEDGIY